MGRDLAAIARKDTYKDLLHLDNLNAGLHATLHPLVTGEGVDSPLLLSSAYVGVGELGERAGLRIATENATMAYWLSTDTVQFEGTDDHILRFGWNVRHTGEEPLVAGEPAVYLQIESDYDIGATEYCEIFFHYASADGLTFRRPIQSVINRATHECRTYFNGRVDFNDNDGTLRATFTESGGLSFESGNLTHNVNGVSFLKQKNAAGTALINVIFLDGADRAMTPSLFVVPTTINHHGVEIRSNASQVGDWLQFQKSDGTSLLEAYETASSTVAALDCHASNRLAINSDNHMQFAAKWGGYEFETYERFNFWYGYKWASSTIVPNVLAAATTGGGLAGGAMCFDTNVIFAFMHRNAFMQTAIEHDGTILGPAMGIGTTPPKVDQPVISSVVNESNPGTTTWGYRVAAVFSDGTTSLASEEVFVTNGNADLSVGRNIITWSSVTGAVYYDVYRTTGPADHGNYVQRYDGTQVIDDGGSVTTTRQPAIDQHFGSVNLLTSDQEEIDVSVVAMTTDSAADLLPANGMIEAIGYYVTDSITNATTLEIGDATTSDRFGVITVLTQGSSGILYDQQDKTGAAGPLQPSAAKVRLTATGSQPDAGSVRLIIWSRRFTAPTR